MEGLNLGVHKIFKCEFRSGSCVALEDEETVPAYDQRTRIWKVNSIKAVSMLNKIQQQVINIYNKKEQIKFRRFFPGENEHNCFTWAKEKLKESDIVDLGEKTFFGILPARVKNYTESGSSMNGGTFSTNVWWNNKIMNDILYESETSILEMESI